MIIHFLTFKQFYLRAFWCVQYLSVEFFDDWFVEFKNIVAILKNNSTI